ncbi:hypothetical protein CIHG_00655 [Coccidioides immitis H538.4]|uniref:Uncharacterized protein n=3 Tax=Coccidioides immitis TaxID=5501 RepID=A0A0J8QH57_COCIT|nr:hypothetical protein CIRG_07466 [Coccidioides immitis RMSCC 2394]KMU71760.1 hypothetical protein CISG_00070 [Coccidioides immitis RMSCC 3703]KMU82872.1 hypothetical protein CIHG_00655 [Coccidioides immitis H538.4]
MPIKAGSGIDFWSRSRSVSTWVCNYLRGVTQEVPSNPATQRIQTQKLGIRSSGLISIQYNILPGSTLWIIIIHRVKVSGIYCLPYALLLIPTQVQIPVRGDKGQ